MLLLTLFLCLVFSIYEVNCACGLRNVDGVGMKLDVNENMAQYGEFPWTVSILKIERTPLGPLNVYRCDGSLIHPSVVLTEAHCIIDKDSSDFKIRSGEWDTQTKDEIYPHQDAKVSEYIIHEQYDKQALFNDVALLFLEKPFEITETVNTICLPPQNENLDLDKSLCVASGYAKDLFELDGKYPTIMQYLDLSVVPREKCLMKLRKTELGPDFELNNSFICADGNKTICKNKNKESGGGAPLVCSIRNTDNMYYQVGMLSWSDGCGTSTLGVYANIPLFTNWIHEKLKLKNLSITSVPVVSTT